MKVTKEATGDLTAVLRIDISSEDYANKVEEQLKNYRKKANVPGFRPGQVPMGMIKKLYEKSLRAEEIQKLLTDSMYDFIESEKIRTLGHPLANDEKTGDIDWDNQNEFTFYFDIAIQPEIELNLENVEETYYNIVPTEEMINKFIEDIQRRFGKFSSPEEIGENDLVYGEITELDEEGNEKENGIKTPTSIAINMIAQKTIQKKFISKAKDSEIVFNLSKAFTNATDVASMLKISKEEAEEFKSDVKFTVSSINRVELAQLDEVFFENAYRGQDIKTIEQFRERAIKDLSGTYSREAERYFLNEASTRLVENSGLELPDEFMKKWLIANNEGKVDAEKIEKEYDSYKNSLKWQLIENNIIEKYSVDISQQDLKDYYINFVLSNYFPLQGNETPEQETERINTMDKIANDMLKNKEQSKQIYEYLFDQKLVSVLKSNMKVNVKDISVEDFTKMVQEKNK